MTESMQFRRARQAAANGLRMTMLVLATCSACAWADPEQTNIKADENVVFFRTEASRVADEDEWVVPIHGWVYEEERSWLLRNAFSRSLDIKYGLTLDDENSVFFDRRAGLLTADNERNKVVAIEIGDESYTLPKSEPNGHFKGEVRISESDVEGLAEEDIVEFRALLSGNDDRDFSGSFRLTSPTGTSIISDIDDTVKVTGVTTKRELFENTFYREFAAVTGMADRYREWAEQGLDIHFLSSSPWQLYPELLDFAEVNDFPWATFYLKDVRFKDRTALNLFKEGSVTKPIQIAELMDRYPQRQFVLIGDSGEHDPEAYTLIMEQYPERVEGIYIRNITDESLDNERFSELTAQLPEGAIELFEDPQEITLQ